MRALVMCVCLVCVNYKGRRGSVAIADVPVRPLDSFGTGSTPTGTLLPLLLQALHRDLCQHRVAGVDSVLIELDFFHVRKIGWIQRKVNRVGTVPRPSHAVEHFGNCLLIFFEGGEAVTEPSGNLTDRSIHGIASLLDHLQAVGVLCFVHEYMMAQIHGFGSSR